MQRVLNLSRRRISASGTTCGRLWEYGKVSKYRAKKTTIDGIVFDSRKEAARWLELKELEKAGEIAVLRRQETFVLIPEQRGTDGKLIERRCTYKADFVYVENGSTVVEDVKGVKTKDYIIKRKLMLWVHGIKIREV